MARNGSKTFVTITNMQIYKELCQFKADNTIEHQNILNMVAGYKSQVFNLKMAVGGIGLLAMTTLGFLISHLV